MTLRLFAWNIRQGGGTRLSRIAAAIAQHDADVLVISEYRGGDSGERLRASLAAIGYRHTTALTPPSAGGNGVLIALAIRSTMAARSTMQCRIPAAWCAPISVRFASTASTRRTS
jgi:hypothetical protein